MEISSLQKVKICIFGIQGSGKTFFVENFLMEKYKNPIIYLMHEEDFKDRGGHVETIIPKDEEGNVDLHIKRIIQLENLTKAMETHWRKHKKQ